MLYQWSDGLRAGIWCAQLGEVDAAASRVSAPEHGVHLDIASPGDISSFFWAHSQPPPPGLVECSVAYGTHTLSCCQHTCRTCRRAK